MTLSYKVSDDGGYISIITPKVFAVGHDSKYVFAKQHPDRVKGITLYYIIPIDIKNKYWVDEEIIGPFNEENFKTKLGELGIKSSSDLFQTEFDDL